MQRSLFPSIPESGRTLALAAGLLSAGFVTIARADFTGPYTVLPLPSSIYDQNGQPDAPFGNWQLSGNDYHFFALQVDAAPDAVTLDTGHAEDDGGGDLIQIMFTTTAAADGPLSFNYQLSLANTYDDSAAYSINGMRTQLAAGSNSVSGVTLHAGDVFGFFVQAGPQELAKNIISDTVLTVTDFTAPVPEPSTSGWIGLGLGLGWAGIAWRRRRLAMRGAQKH